MNIAVCDDDKIVLQQMEQYLNTISGELGADFSVFYFSSGEEVLDSLPASTDVLFLDIQMGGMNGMETARRLRERFENLYLIFITGNIEFALEGYSVHAFSFLPKPVNYHSLMKIMKEIVSRRKAVNEPAITLTAGAVTDVIRCSSILYIEVLHHDIFVVSKQGRKQYRLSLSEVERKLEGMHFFRCHKSYLINLAQIASASSTEIIMSNNDRVPVSKYRAREFLDAFAAYAGDMIG
ncbi:MAG: LytTR family DNA-binding domain-containing protein [Solobacterium sp.]|nr:LytTR family DNA-binding domain-containing protein [Solobacterium sp.]